MNTTHQNPRTGPTTWRRGLLAALLVAGLTTLGSIAGAGAASADTGASFAGCPQLDEGDTGPCITQLQQKLTKVHPEYNLPGSETFGPATRIALLDFQGRNHLGADGRFGTTTARELDRQYDAANRGAVASPTAKPVETTPAGSSLPGCPQLDVGATGPCVAQLQQLLNKVHPEYQLPGSQTYGSQTQAAVRDFQERNHITGGNGQFGPGTAKALQSQAADLGDTPAAGTDQSPSSGTTAGSGAPSSTGTTGTTGDGTPNPPVPNPSVPPVDAPAPARDGKKLVGKNANETGCDADAYTVKTAPMIIEQQRPVATETSLGAKVSAEGEAEGEAAGAGAGAGPAGAGAGAGKGKTKGKVDGGITGSRRSETTTVETTIGDIEVRYSPSCHTAWARVATEDESALSGIAISDGAHRENHDIHPRPGKGGATKPGSFFSPMVAVGPNTRVQGSLDGEAGGGAKLARDKAPSTGWVTPATTSPIN